MASARIRPRIERRRLRPQRITGTVRQLDGWPPGHFAAWGDGAPPRRTLSDSAPSPKPAPSAPTGPSAS
ncbi:MAG TPA: hypothetical protein PLD23_21080 [Armatimonadota bacterium]|nr:hypothetical protein [Armatimonadota bacterium]